VRRALALLLMTALAAALPAVANASSPAPPKCELASCDDPLFTVFYPPRTTYTTSHGVTVDIPTHFYDGNVLNMYGTADLRALQELTAGSGYQPVETDDGHGIANVDVNEWKDSNLEPYHELVINLVVNTHRVVVPASSNPYETIGAAVDPQNQLWVVKMALNRQLPIDVGRDYYGIDKEPLPQVTHIAMSDSGVDFSDATPDGSPVVTGHVPIAKDPASQMAAYSRFGATQGFQRMSADIAAHYGLIRFNYVHRHLSAPATIDKAHGAGRLFTTGATLGRFGPDASLTVHPANDFGDKLKHIDFHPLVDVVLLDGRWILADGFAPAVYPSP
jgi:hypothetical protein